MVKYHSPFGKNSVKEMLKFSFEAYYYSGSMIGGSIKVYPRIYLKNGVVIDDIRIGYQTYTTWAHESNQFKKGEAVADCLKRHGITIDDVKEITMSLVDTTGEKKIVENFSWDEKNGWKRTSYKEII